MSINHRKHQHAGPGQHPGGFVHSGQIPGYRISSYAAQAAETRRLLAQKQIKDGSEVRKAPVFYAGETYSRHIVQHDNVERLANGTVASTRNKIARRLIRGALKAKFSRLTSSLRLARGLRAQAYSLAREEKRSSRWGLRLLAKELAIHQTVYAPTGPELRAMRTMKRARARKGVAQDAITALVDRMAGTGAP